MAPSTPPPPSSEVLAALTMASTSSLVMSPWTGMSWAMVSASIWVRVENTPGERSWSHILSAEKGARGIVLFSAHLNSGGPSGGLTLAATHLYGWPVACRNSDRLLMTDLEKIRAILTDSHF